MEKAHTPGPWVVTRVSSELPATTVVGDYGQRLVCDCETEVDADLIAAAPELLVELEAARDIIHNALSLMTTAQKSEWGRLNEAAGVEGEGVTRRHERNAVIAKATGKA